MGHHSYVDKKLLNFIESMDEYPKACKRLLESDDSPSARSSASGSDWSKALQDMYEHRARIDNYILNIVKDRLHAVLDDAPDEC